jgi:hypothetical protein
MTADRACGWCGVVIPPWMRSDARTCSQHCRQRLHRFGVAPVGSSAAAPMRFAYADPPYPGLARRYYGMPEVDHVALVRQLVAKYPDGWALSTSSDAAIEVAAIVRAETAARVPVHARPRMLSWVRGSRPGVAWSSRDAWEPVFVCGGRPRKLDVGDELDNALVLSVHQRQRTHPGALVGMKPAGFCEWLFRQLGAMRGDEFADVFPGSGAVMRAWKMYTREPSDVDARRVVPSRLVAAQLPRSFACHFCHGMDSYEVSSAAQCSACAGTGVHPDGDDPHAGMDGDEVRACGVCWSAVGEEPPSPYGDASEQDIAGDVGDR